ncbi:transcriptional regulator [Psychrobacillus psychrodurans]|uniref:transcriptional regulator n=1 Tax=Psychrobacillus psychrodurans TaxID=126157 RepID=UPI003D038F0B
MGVYKLRVGTIKHIEAELFDYHDTIKRIKERREELMTDPPKEEGMPFNQTIRSSSVERYATRLTMDLQLKELERIASAVEHVYNLCDDSRKKLIRLKYWTRPQLKSWEGIAQELHISRRQAFYWRDEVVQAVGEKLGWW